MRILVATAQWFPDFHGGSARVAAETATRLAARGHDVTVLAPRSPGRPEEERSGRLRLLRRLPRSPLPESVTDVLATRRLVRRMGSFDLLLAHHATVAAGLASARLPAPLVAVYHASPALEARYLAARAPGTREGLAARTLAPGLARLERKALRRSARVLVLSDFSRRLAVAAEPSVASKVVVVSGGTDIDHFSPGDGPQAARDRLGVEAAGPLLFSARRLEPRMGLDLLLRTLANLPGARLAVAGTGILDESLRRLAVELGVADRASFLGRVTEDELRDWYRAADVVVLPTTAYEGFGLAAVEALSCGTPVVGTPVGAIPEVLAPLEERLVSAAADPESLAASVKRALSSQAELRRRCRDYAVARFDWERVLDTWEEALTETASARPERFGVPLDPISLEQTVDLVDEGIASGRRLLHASVNAAKLVRAQQDTELADALRACDVVTADGQPVVWAARLAGLRLPGRVAGIDLMEALLARAEQRGYGVYLLGARADVLELATAEIARRHPKLKLVGVQHGYFRPDEERAVVEQIAAAGPDIVLIGLETPQKELFQVRYRDELGASFVMGVGGAFDVLAGRARRAPRWVQRAGLEWSFRLAQEPRRLFGRYLVGNARFIALAGQEVLRRRTTRLSSG